MALAKRIQSNLIKDIDWSTMIILDACRFDIFKEVYNEMNLNGRLLQVNSRATHTEVWYRRNWNSHYSDIILVTATPKVKWEGFNSHFNKAIECWTKEEWLNPKATLDVAIKVQNMNKKLLIHLVPPHLPYIHKKGKDFLKNLKVNAKIGSPNVYARVRQYGRINGWEELKKYYKDSLKKALETIEKYLSKLNKPIIITSDHGEKIGEGNTYDHAGTPLDCLLNVPWLEIK